TPGEQAIAATPPMVRPARPNGASQPLLDESSIKGDSESLELENDDTNAAGRAPQMLARPAATGSNQSPYSGLKIAPNDIEEKADTALSAAPAAAAPTPAVPVTAPVKENPAIAARANQPPAAPPKPAAPAAKVKNADLGLDDEEDQDDDDE